MQERIFLKIELNVTVYVANHDAGSFLHQYKVTFTKASFSRLSVMNVLIKETTRPLVSILDT